ncbi:HIRAN domain-containing protein [Sphingomonas sp.]|jgi:HIRAN domain|uniref:HIRAN domain-containing protein n=1 Tax=Sphingomonas sp. TaxID=28214 RepID=UPI0035C81DBD
MRQQSIAVVGLPYANRKGPTRRFEAELCAPGEAVELRPEPNNRHDRWAVAVFSVRGVQLGYVNAERASWIGGMIREGREIAAVFQGVVHNTAWCRIAFDGEVPILPPQRAQEEPADDSGFFPDAIYDD